MRGSSGQPPLHASRLRRIQRRSAILRPGIAVLLEAAEKQYEDASAPLYGRLATIKQALRDEQNAKQRLWETCEDDGLLAELESVTEALRQANKALSRQLSAFRKRPSPLLS